MYNIEEILNQTFAGNSVKNILIFLGTTLITLIVFRIFRMVFIRRLKNKKIEKITKIGLIEAILMAIKNISGLFYLAVAIYFPLKFLTLPQTVNNWISAIFIVILIIESIRAAHIFIDYFIKEILLKQEGNAGKTESAFMGIKLVANILLWTLGGLLILSNIGINITSLVAGLGIGGIAVALAVQNILGDIFSSFSIYFDKPFEIGDFIIVGEHMGVVKKVGIKTTRLQSIQGEEIVISNKELTSTRIQNFKKMRKRRVLLNFGLVYGTTVAKMKKADEIVKKIISKTSDVEFDRCHFMEFGDFSLRFEAVYFVDSGDFSLFRDKQEEINLEIKEKFEKEGIQMAFPTQTIHLEK
jgi:small-conductance mechanosensitive channel